MTGILGVAGLIDSDGETISFGAPGAVAPVELKYTDANGDTFTLTVNRYPASWLWAHNHSTNGTTTPAMRLNQNHELLLYPADASTHTVALTPGASSSSLTLGGTGGATLSNSGGTLITSGGLVVGGNFTSANGSLTGGSSGLTLSASGTNQNITLTPSGTGAVLLNGNVGIGTSTPAAPLDVGGTVGDGSLRSVLARLTEGNTTGDGTLLGVRAWSTQPGNAMMFSFESTFYGARNNAINFYRGGGATGGFMTFATGDATERVRITSDGKVGIGTTDPAQKLHVAGDGAGLLLEDTGAGGHKYSLSSRSGGYFSLLDEAAPSQARLAISPLGNVGINTSTPDAKLAVREDNVEISLGRSSGGDVNGYARMGFNANFIQYITNNAWWNGSSWQYVNQSGYGGVATRFLNSFGTFQFDTAAGGTAPTWGTRLYIANDGKIGIGTTQPTYLLSVKGTIRAQEIIVDNTNWADYVFDENYALTPLSEVEAHIKAEKHLPGIPSSQEVAERGVSLSEMQAKLLQKVEELTLHQIAQEKRLNEQAERIRALETENVVLRGQ